MSDRIKFKKFSSAVIGVHGAAGYLKDFEQAKDRIVAMGGTIQAITSQVDNTSKQSLGLTFDVVSDAKNIETIKYGFFITPKEETPLAEVEGQYLQGMAQPAVIVEDSKGQILYEWKIIPSENELRRCD